MGLVFEWDPEKAHHNAEKHGVTFEEASTVFGDPLSLTLADPLHSSDEERFVLIGESVGRRILVVVHREHGDTIRIISARVATGRERRSYAEDDTQSG